MSEPKSVGHSPKITVVPDDAFFEVPASKLPTAESWLATVAVVRQDDAKFFGRSDFSCSAPAKIYLVRASYENGGTGVFKLEWHGTALVVIHEALGEKSEEKMTALVACLSHVPTAVYTEILGAL